MLPSTLEISKSSGKILNSTPVSTSKGLSSGHLEVFKTESELCLRPGSPDRYNFALTQAETSPPEKVASKNETLSECSFQEVTNHHSFHPTPEQNYSLMLEFECENIPDIGKSFFSSGNDAEELSLFNCDKESAEKLGTLNSFTSTNSKTNKFHEELLQICAETKRNYRNNCRILCKNCNEIITTDVKITNPTQSFFDKILCSLCITAEKATQCRYFCTVCKRFLTFRMDVFEFNFN